MTAVTSGSNVVFFRDKEEIVDHLLNKVLANKKRYIGTEWEMFFVSPHGKPITREDGQKAFIEFKRVFALMGYRSEYICEKADDVEKIVGLNINGLGILTPEIGHQFEFACSVCENCDEVNEKNDEAYRAITEVAKRLNYVPVFNGHVPRYAEETEGTYRSRSKQWRVYYDNLFGADSPFIRMVLDSTASTQVTINSGAENFHEFYQALLLIEPALTLHYTNSQRPYICVKAYGHYLPSQVEPIVNVWGTKNPREALEIIVDRLMTLDVPFLPDLDHPGTYKEEPFINGRSATVADLMSQGRLNENLLNNVGGFILTRPGFRNFSQALLELRGVDSQHTSERVTELAHRVVNLIYDDAVRKRLLSDYSHLTQADIRKLHDAAAIGEKATAFNQQIAGARMVDFVGDIIARSEETIPAVASRFAPLIKVREPISLGLH